MSPAPELVQRADLRPLWPAFLGLGVALALAGFAALLAPNVMEKWGVLLWGYFLITRGVVDCIGSFFTRRQGAFLSHLLQGVLGLVVGVLIVTHEEKAEKVILMLIAVFLLVSGVVQIVAGLALRSEAWLYVLLSGLVGVVVGVLVWRNVGDPEKSSYILGIFIGLDLLSRGGTWIGLGLAAKNASTGSPPMAT